MARPPRHAPPFSHLTDYLHRTQPTARPAASQLSDELARIEPWLHILAIRFGAACAGASTPASKPPGCQLPPMLLQTWWKRHPPRHRTCRARRRAEYLC